MTFQARSAGSAVSALAATMVAALVSGEAHAAAISGSRTARLERCITDAAESLPGPVAPVLQRIDGTGRRLLALRSYLRASDSLTERWSWSEAQIADYRHSREYGAVQGELESIAARFAQTNPGYALYVNSEVRSLDTQVRRWNENASVGAAAKALENAASREVGRSSCSGDSQPAGGTFESFLKVWRPAPRPTLAAPGLSKHGQARAFDFQVRQGSRIVAATDSSQSASVWDRKGWTRKLRAAVSAASDKFTGPLQDPYEPWHYEYHP
jgi:hypothetical protein